MGGLVQRDDLAAAQHERDGEQRARRARSGRPSTTAAPRTMSPGASPQPRGAASTRSRTRAMQPAPASRHSVTTAPASSGRANTSDGKQDRLPQLDLGDGVGEVSAIDRGEGGEDRGAGDDARDPRVRPCEARTPDRAAKIAVNAANASGASERTKDAASRSMPATAR